FVDGQDTPIVTDSIHAAGTVDIYVRPGDLRLAEDGGPGFEAIVRSTQRTGPILRCEAVTTGSNVPIEIEVPHLHHDAQQLRRDARVRLRLNQFSIFTSRGRTNAAKPVEAPVLIGSERERGRLG
ncbi:MAG TPA: sulfate ABC transporter ATP-binding protein, partial [Nevskiaceae bacterium]|nr:sulfate ABC transporter ATP-binding protein [Nevskiaceae bacterium]